MGPWLVLRWQPQRQLLLRTYGSRPAFLIPSDFAVEDDSNPLEGYSNRELMEELFRRVDK